MDDSTRRALARAVEVHQRGDTTAAEAAYRALYAQDAHPEIAHLLAIALHQQKRFEESLPWFERARPGASLAFHVARRVAEHLGDPRRFAGELRAAFDRAWSLRAGEGFAAVSRRA